MRRNADGDIEIEVTESPKRGRPNEPTVLRVLGDAFTQSGRSVPVREGAEDDRGEDGLVRSEGAAPLIIQVVSVPVDEKFGADVAKGKAARTISDAEAVAWVREAIEHKLTIAPANRATTLLALDVRWAGLFCSDPALLAAYAAIRQELQQYGFAEIWLVGATAPLCVRLA